MTSPVAVKAPVMVGLAIEGEPEKTTFVEVVPVVPAAENPVMLLKQVIDATAQFVPPLAIPSVPARVTAPVVAEFGVKPVVPAEKEETAPAA